MILWLWLALAAVLTYAVKPLIFKPRTRPVRTARPGRAAPDPLPGAARSPRGEVPIVDITAMYATRDELLRRPRNGARMPDRLRETPEPFQFRVPPYYTAWLAEQAEGGQPE